MDEPSHELIPLTEPDRWNASLAEVPHGHAHTWGFCHAVALTTGLPTYLYRYERASALVICALSERELSGLTDVVTPYGFGGFAARGSSERFPADWAEFARSRAWVCGYLALNPLLRSAEGFPDDEIHVHNHLYVMDLRGSAEEVFRRLSQNRRRQLRDWPSAAAGLNHDRRALIRFFVDTYADFFERKGAGSATRFAPETMAAIGALDDVLMVGDGAEGRIEAVAVFGHTPTAGDYLFNVSLPGEERRAVQLIWSGVEQLRELGVPSLNLGGGVREGDDLAEFKRRFGAAERPLVSLRQVYRPRAYDCLCGRSGASLEDRAGHFPAYRG